MSDKVESKLVDLGWEKIKTNIKRLKNTEITVGVMGEEAHIKDPDSDVTVVDYAVYNHFGTKNKAGVQVIPPRPFLQMGLDNNKKQIVKFINKNIKFLTENEGASVESALNRIGAFLVAAIQREITNGDFVENAETTKKRKGHSKPLVGGRIAYAKRDKDKTVVAAETGGRLRSSITYEIRY